MMQQEFEKLTKVKVTSEEYTSLKPHTWLVKKTSRFSASSGSKKTVSGIC